MIDMCLLQNYFKKKITSFYNLKINQPMLGHQKLMFIFFTIKNTLLIASQ